MNKFNIGDRVVVIANPPEWRPGMRDLLGVECTVIEDIQQLYNEVSKRAAMCYAVDIRNTSFGSRIAFEPHCLKLIYDGNIKTEWDESIFKPKELVKCQNV